MPVIRLEAAPDGARLTATLAGVSASDSPTGTVTFKDGGEVLGAATLSEGTAVFTWRTVPAGRYDLAAAYSGDGNYEGVDGSCTLVVADTPSSDGNTISGITPGSILRIGESITFTASGVGMNNLNPNEGDTRYVPASWSVNPSGTWTASPYTATFSISEVGNYTLKVVFNREVYTGGVWKTDGATDTKTVSFEVGDTSIPQTGDSALSLWPFAAGGAIALGMVLWFAPNLRKRRA